jgi:hypothetical protein
VPLRFKPGGEPEVHAAETGRNARQDSNQAEIPRGRRHGLAQLGGAARGSDSRGGEPRGWDKGQIQRWGASRSDPSHAADNPGRRAAWSMPPRPREARRLITQESGAILGARWSVRLRTRKRTDSRPSKPATVKATTVTPQIATDEKTETYGSVSVVAVLLGGGP